MNGRSARKPFGPLLSTRRLPERDSSAPFAAPRAPLHGAGPGPHVVNRPSRRHQPARERHTGSIRNGSSTSNLLNSDSSREGGQYTVRDRRTARRARVVAAIPARIPRKSLRKRRLSKGPFLDLTLVVVYSPRKSFDVIFSWRRSGALVSLVGGP